MIRDAASKHFSSPQHCRDGRLTDLRDVIRRPQRQHPITQRASVADEYADGALSQEAIGMHARQGRSSRHRFRQNSSGPLLGLAQRRTLVPKLAGERIDSNKLPRGDLGEPRLREFQASDVASNGDCRGRAQPPADIGRA